MDVLLTGATGYIGSHIAKNLLESGYKVYATCRKDSKFDKCILFADKLDWLNLDDENWQKKIEKIQLDLLIHTAWAGVSATERDNWDVQFTNFYFSKSIIDFSLGLKVKKIICLGSQAEYGNFKNRVTEAHVPYPTDAYGAVKLMTLYYLKNIADKQKVDWYWLRVFSIIGENENETWLLPQVMTKLCAQQEIELTEGRQCYDYLYMDDFIQRLNQVITCQSSDSGVYNICSGRSVEIRQLLILIANKLNISTSKLKFGAVPYRKNQNMLMVGSPDYFENTFGNLSIDSIEDTVIKITEFYKSKTK
jgi:nucleoside-diphosphate-sugar epimerase